ncbi:MAG: hypothetical protein M3P87_01345, partial [Actinomycetota bacterium]|nr:hypothetical protein [Actinomycetota bacterium]
KHTGPSMRPLKFAASNEPHGPFPFFGARLAFAGLDLIHVFRVVDHVKVPSPAPTHPEKIH